MADLPVVVLSVAGYVRPRKERKPCPVCSSRVENLDSTYCSNACQMEAQYKAYVQAWKAGEISGTKSGGVCLSNHVRRYLLETRGEKCSECGWSERNPVTGKVPVTVNHKDGDWRRSSEDNLEVLCPNCHSLTPTYGNLNKGRGRPHRPIRCGALSQ